eukprot:maker-scaffold1709_size30467-snap-gene-0.4 protein:Tk11845 transcript:maker-scaffold1709_size30467-snap-gene-0.4-mRNA-1 annotation:"patatin-like phospholipase"
MNIYHRPPPDMDRSLELPNFTTGGLNMENPVPELLLGAENDVGNANFGLSLDLGTDMQEKSPVPLVEPTLVRLHKILTVTKTLLNVADGVPTFGRKILDPDPITYLDLPKSLAFEDEGGPRLAFTTSQRALRQRGKDSSQQTKKLLKSPDALRPTELENPIPKNRDDGSRGEVTEAAQEDVTGKAIHHHQPVSCGRLEEVHGHS